MQNEIQELWSGCNQILFIKKEVLYKHEDDIMPQTTLKGTMAAVLFNRGNCLTIRSIGWLTHLSQWCSMLKICKLSTSRETAPWWTCGSKQEWTAIQNMLIWRELDHSKELSKQFYNSILQYSIMKTYLSKWEILRRGHHSSYQCYIGKYNDDSRDFTKPQIWCNNCADKYRWFFIWWWLWCLQWRWMLANQRQRWTCWSKLHFCLLLYSSTKTWMQH